MCLCFRALEFRNLVICITMQTSQKSLYRYEGWHFFSGVQKCLYSTGMPVHDMPKMTEYFSEIINLKCKILDIFKFWDYI